MTTARQIKQVFRPLVARHEDLVQVDGSYLWIKPVRHIGLRILIDRSSHADFCAPRWIMLETFIPFRSNPDIIGRYTGHLSRPGTSPNKYWNWSDPTMITDAIAVIEAEAVPLLRSIDTVEAFAAFYRDRFDRYRLEQPYNRMIVDIALGDIETARKTWHALAPVYRDNVYPDDSHFQTCRHKVLTVAEPLMADDRPALAKILHGWEADNIRGTKIEPYWEPTPFPLERTPA